MLTQTKSFIAGCLAAACLFTAAAEAQQRNPGGDIQVLLAEAATWSLEFSQIISTASEPLDSIDTFVAILDNLSADKITDEEAAGQMAAWREQALASTGRARRAAEALAPPPTFAHLGPDGVQLDAAYTGNHQAVLPLVQEFENVVIALADMGDHAVRDPTKAYEARSRAVLNASMQLIRVDRDRMELSAATLRTNHPQQAIVVATQHYYNALLAVPALALAELDGGGDTAATVAILRAEAHAMRGELARAERLVQPMMETLPVELAGAPPELLEAALGAFRTYPPSIRSYERLADNIDVSAASLERGGEPLDVWSDQELLDRPHLAEIDRLNGVRAQLIANNNRRAL